MPDDAFDGLVRDLQVHCALGHENCECELIAQQIDDARPLLDAALDEPSWDFSGVAYCIEYFVRAVHDDAGWKQFASSSYPGAPTVVGHWSWQLHLALTYVWSTRLCRRSRTTGIWSHILLEAPAP